MSVSATKKEWLRKNPWKSHLDCIRRRCNNPKTNGYKWYGGKGIKCLLTYSDMRYLYDKYEALKMERPSVDRIDSDGHYTVENCRIIEHSLNCSLSQRKN